MSRPGLWNKNKIRNYFNDLANRRQLILILQELILSILLLSSSKSQWPPWTPQPSTTAKTATTTKTASLAATRSRFFSNLAPTEAWQIQPEVEHSSANAKKTFSEKFSESYLKNSLKRVITCLLVLLFCSAGLPLARIRWFDQHFHATVHFPLTKTID